MARRHNIHLTEGELRNLVRESVKKAVMKEGLGKFLKKGVNKAKEIGKKVSDYADKEWEDEPVKKKAGESIWGTNTPGEVKESRIDRIIRESINKVVNEGGHLYGHYDDGTPFTNSKDKWHGVDGTTFISHGSWSDPEVWYKGHEINGSELEEYMWNQYKYECEEDGREISEEEYDSLPAEWFADELENFIVDYTD